MLVYGDRSEEVDPRRYAEALSARCHVPAADRFTVGRHASIVGLLIDMGKLAQGLADAAFAAQGVDDDAYPFAPIAAHQLAARAAVSWLDGWDLPVEPPNALAYLLEQDLPEAVTLREPEGYAFYAVYPELYAEAARSHAEERSGMAAVVGLRSIGTSLGAAAAFSGAGYPPITLRPFGDPSARQVAVTPALRTRLERRSRNGVLVVDEGPGASGSSFAAVGDLFEGMGVPPDRITYMPSHLGYPGPQASPRRRERWRTARKAYAGFEDVILPRLPDWVEPLIGPLAEPLRDLSGGRWREIAGDAPAWPQQERRKYLAVTENSRFLLKFSGLGAIGERKLVRGQAMHAAGFTPEPIGLAHGFLVERWIEGPAAPPEERDLETLGRYLGFRARTLPPPAGAATDAELRAMMRRNLDLAGLPDAAAVADGLVGGERGPPCAVDGRLHAWEWRAADGRPLKLDALDHCEAHDLIGAQDLAWDIAAAAVELDLAPATAERLRRIASEEAARPVDPRRVAFQTLAYLAFQIGWWTLASQAGAGNSADARARAYQDHARCWSPA